MALPAQATIPEDLLVEIFLRLPTPDALAHAAAACTSFRRLVKGRAFRRRFRALHRPPLLGFMDAAGFHPAEAPHPSAPLAGALASYVEDFSFVPPVVSSASYHSVGPGDDQLPRWRPRDARDGRVLLDWVSLHPRSVRMWGDPGDRVSVLMDCNEVVHRPGDSAWIKREYCNAADFHFAVCDPLSRRFDLLPTIPDDIAARPGERLLEFVPMLAPTTADDREDDSLNLKVIFIARYETKTALFVFLATTRQWCNWSMATFPVFTPLGALSCFDCVRGCFYWTNPWDRSDYLLVLDTCSMKFSSINLLTGYHVQLRDLPNQNIGSRRPSAIVVGREGVIDMFSIVGQESSCTLHHTSLHNGSQEWKLEKIIPLPDQYQDYFVSTVGASEGFLFFQSAPVSIHDDNVGCYSLEVKTYEITKVCCKMEIFLNRRHALPYFSFPPLLSEPSI